jgi:hypothetical protein
MEEAINQTTILSDVTDKSKEVFKSFGEEIKKAEPVLSKAGSVIMSTFGPAVAFLFDKIKSITFTDVGAILGGLGAFFIGKSFKDMIGSFQEVTKGFSGVIDGISGSLEAFQTRLKAEALLRIGMAIGILAASILALSLIDQESLTKALYALTVVFVELSGALLVLQKGTFSAAGLSTTLLSLGIAILFISAAMTKLSKIDSAGLTQGIEGLAAILTTLAVFQRVTSGTTGIQGSIVGLIGLSVAVLILTDAVKKFSELDGDALDKGIQAIGASLGELALFIKLIGSPERVISIGVGMMAIALAMDLFAKAVGAFGNLGLSTLIQGVSGIAAVLTSVALTMRLLPDNASMIATGVGLNLMAVALYTISGAVAIFGNMSLETLATGIGALAAALTVMALTAKLMTGTLTGAASLVVMALAINMLVPAIALLGNLDLKTIGVALIALAGVFTVLGISALVLAPLAPVILSLAGSITLLGIGVYAIGAGLVLFAAGLAAVAAGGAVFAAAIIGLLTTVIRAIPGLAEDIGKAFQAIASVLIKAFNDLIVPVVDASIKFIMELLTKLAQYVQPMVEVGLKLVEGFLRGIANNIQGVVEAAADLIVAFLKGINNKLPDVIEVAITVIETLIVGLGKLADRVINAGFQLMVDLVNGLAKAVDEKMPMLMEAFVNLGGAIISGLVKGLGGGLKTAALAIAEVGKTIVEGFKDILGIHSPSRVFADLGKYSVQGFAVGLNRFSGLASQEANAVGVNAMDSLRNAVSNMSDVIDSNIDTNPTIRPVIDLSNVTSGADTINSMFDKNQGITVSSANGKVGVIASGMRTSTDVQNGSSSQVPTIQNPSDTSRPVTLQLMLQNGKAIAEFIVDDLDSFGLR